ncbi:hypothetical protein PPYR_07001 [Photinus pyralis]|uniref:Uncharacterized protein n=1 Tax=Photinus pyralis TaxID=7054 RepID=A0A5N4AP89_PHOPY|nr:4-coumarate--CoA ligase 1-like [Photinus pyralis]KAB0799121.1 hypothetical protein PPYR_07001 [Photinus pyralis]
MFRFTLRVKTTDLFSSFLKTNNSSGFVRIQRAASAIRCHLPNVNVPALTVPEFIFQNFSKHPHKTALECAETGRRYTFEEVRRKSLNLNKALRQKFHLKQKDIVALVLPNIPEYAICLLGALQAGLRVTTVNPFGTADEIKSQLQDTEAKVIITTCQLGEFADTVVQRLQKQIPIVTIKTEVTNTIAPGKVNFQELIDTVCDLNDVCPSNTHDIAVIPYSSGTTGKQKGVLHSHNTLIATVVAVSCKTLYPLKDTTDNFQETTPAVLPFFHIYGLTVVLLSQLYSLVNIITISKFTPTLFLDSLLKYKPSTMCLVPPLVLFMANNESVTRAHFEFLEAIYSGAAPLGASDELKLVNRSGKDLKIYQGYGLTEAPVVTAFYQGVDIPSGSVGRAIQNTQMKIVPVDNPKADHLGANQPGELLCKGSQLMLGYYNKDKESADAFVDGWFKTGDLVYMDKANNMFVQDRLKELIKVKGYQVPPAELEELIRTYPNVLDAVVIGIPHEQYGEVPRAYLSVKADTKINLQHLDEFIASKVSKYKRIAGGFAIVDKIPKTASGKYLRKDIKLQYMQEMKQSSNL